MNNETSITVNVTLVKPDEESFKAIKFLAQE
jgi:hypothetical protein